jgi:hypothetical protein
MRFLFITLFILVCKFSFGQRRQVDSLTFCFTKYKVPAGCSSETKYQVMCDNYSIVWLYMEDQMLEVIPNQLVSQMSGQLKNFKKEAITCFLVDKEVKGYKISYSKDKVKGYQLIASGIVNGQSVLVQLSLDHDPKDNDDIPSFPRQIIRLTK